MRILSTKYSTPLRPDSDSVQSGLVHCKFACGEYVACPHLKSAPLGRSCSDVSTSYKTTIMTISIQTSLVVDISYIPYILHTPSRMRTAPALPAEDPV